MTVCVHRPCGRELDLRAGDTRENHCCLCDHGRSKQHDADWCPGARDGVIARLPSPHAEAAERSPHLASRDARVAIVGAGSSGGWETGPTRHVGLSPATTKT